MWVDYANLHEKSNVVDAVLGSRWENEGPKCWLGWIAPTIHDKHVSTVGEDNHRCLSQSNKLIPLIVYEAMLICFLTMTLMWSLKVLFENRVDLLHPKPRIYTGTCVASSFLAADASSNTVFPVNAKPNNED
jgi:hypothetical protein